LQANNITDIKFLIFRNYVLQIKVSLNINLRASGNIMCVMKPKNS